jgi:hypothetical protein
MARLLCAWLTPVVMITLAAPAPADDSTRAIVDKAIKAHGGAKRLDQQKAIRSKSKGRLELPAAWTSRRRTASSSTGS